MRNSCSHQIHTHLCIRHGVQTTHMPKPCNHKHLSESKPTTKGTHPISYGFLALFAFPLLSFYKESSCFLKFLFFNLLSNLYFLSPCWLICKPLGLSLFCQTLLLQSFWLLFFFLHPWNAISSPVRHAQGQKSLEPHRMTREWLSTHHFEHLPFLFFFSPLNQGLACQQFLMFFLNNDFKLRKWLTLPGGPIMCRWLNHADSTGI
jgi:hypothetical protein